MTHGGAPTPCGVLIADDDPVVRAALRRVIDSCPDFRVVAVVEDADAAIASAEELRPRLALIDVSMPGGGPHAAREITRRLGETRVVALSASEDPVTVRMMLAAGVVAYTVKSSPAEDLIDVLRAAAAAPMSQVVGMGDSPLRIGDPSGRITVLVADDEPAVLAALADAISADPELALVGLAQTPGHAASLAARHRPAVALINPRMPAGGGMRAAAEIRYASPHTVVVALSTHADRETVLGMLSSGARGYLLKGAAAGELRDAVRRAASGAAELSDPARSVVLQELVVQLEAGASWAIDRQVIEERIDRALSGGMSTLLQPIVALDDRSVVGYEALTRFDVMPERSAEVWFDEAATVGRGPDLELGAVERALAHLESLPEGSWLAINVSPDVAGSPALRELLRSAPAERLLIEMTEHAPVDDYAALGSALETLRRLGVRIAVDDAGAGFASLRHILLLAPEFIKLDNSLCRGVGSDRARRAMARALVGFAGETGATVIAEGVESDEELDALRQLDVPLGQGFALGPPQPGVAAPVAGHS